MPLGTPECLYIEGRSVRLHLTMEYTAATGLLKASEADPVADFDSIVTLYRPKVFRFILASLRDREVAENLTQDCFLNAFKARASFRSDCSMSTWLMLIAANLVRDHVKSRRLQFWRRLQRNAKPLDEDLRDWISDRQKTPEAQALLKEQVQAVWDAAAALPGKQRMIFLLRFVEDMELKEIAAVTGMKEGTIKTHLFRALNSVRDRIGGQA